MRLTDHMIRLIPTIILSFLSLQPTSLQESKPNITVVKISDDTQGRTHHPF
jgi:hypothetical protein